MAFKIPVRCGETTTTTGTGTVTTGGAPLQMQTFNAGVGTGNTCPYMIVSGDNVNWERGLGTVTVSAGVTTVARTTVVESSNANAAISLVGTSFIFVALPGDVANTNGLLDLVFGSSNGTYNLVRSAGVWTVQAVAAGSSSGLWGSAMSAAPTAAGTGLNTWNNQGSAAVSDTAAGIYLDVDSGHSGLAVRQTNAALPSTPYSYTALISGGPFFSETTGVIPVGIGWTDGTKLHVGYSIGDGGNSINVAKWTNATTVSANDVSVLSVRSGLTWWKIKDDGTNVIWSVSNDGINFVQLFSVAKASGFLGGSGYTKVCFVAGPNTFGKEIGATLMSWTQGT